MSITSEYPLWYVVFCIITALVFAFGLYYRDGKNQEISSRLLMGLAGLRFTIIFLLCFFLIRPLIQWMGYEVFKPVLVVAVDESESIAMVYDSVGLKNNIQDPIVELKKELGDQFQIETYGFGSKVSPLDVSSMKFTDKSTDIGTLMSELEDRYAYRNMAGVLVFSDGIYNRGSSPLMFGGRLKFPVYSVALGDTTTRKDVFIKKVVHNKITYRGNQFPVEVWLGAENAAGEKLKLEMILGNTVLETREIAVTKADFFIKERFYLKAGQNGLQSMKIRVSTLADEYNKENNQQSFFIEVLENRQRILLAYQSPHPDIAFLKRSISSFDNYALELAPLASMPSEINSYNLIIVHGAFGASNKEITTQLLQSGIPVFFVLTGQSSINAFNDLSIGLKVTGGGGKVNQVGSYVSEGFNAFKLPENFSSLLLEAPEITSFFGTYQTLPNTEALLLQKIGPVKSNQSLLYFVPYNNKKVGVLLGEGIWKWGLREYSMYEKHEISNAFINSLVQYLSVQEDKSRFRIFHKKMVAQDDNMSIEAQLYNKAYQPVNEPEVSFNLTNQEGEEFPFLFNKIEDSYQLNLGFLPSGEYRYTAYTQYMGEKLQKEGSFVIKPVELEGADLKANHALLEKMSAQSSGRIFTPENLHELSRALQNDKNIFSISKERKTFKSLIDIKWILGILVLLISIEWFVRKYNGIY